MISFKKNYNICKFSTKLRYFRCVHKCIYVCICGTWRKVDCSVWTNILKATKLNNSSSHVWMWELDHKEGWVPKNWCVWIVVLEKTLENPSDSKEIKLVNSKGNQVLNIHWKDWHWGWNSNRLATWCEEPIHWKRLWCWEKLRAREKGATEDELVGWHHWLNGHEFEQTQGQWRTEEAWHAAVHGVTKSRT